MEFKPTSLLQQFYSFPIDIRFLYPVFWKIIFQLREVYHLDDSYEIIFKFHLPNFHKDPIN